MKGSGLSPVEAQGRRLHRPADRRRGLHTVLRSLASELHASRDRIDLATVLTGQLAGLLPVRDVRLSELKGVGALRDDTPIRSRDYVAFAVPLADPTRRIVLEASFDDGEGLDAWSTQLLESAARLAALVLETPRSAASSLSAMTTRRDGAAPLIGSSAVMQALRERIERVATTDFTVLIEGPSDPQQRSRGSA
ncbi:MAG: hypothetical protein ABR606_10990 [Vicinamibacterales bacterium]